MKRAAWFVLALAVALIVSALPVYAQPLPFALPSCLPAELGGTGKGLTSRKFATGVCRAGWWCQQPDGTWAAYTHCALAEYVTDVLPPLAASSPASAINAAITAGQVTPPANRVAAYNALHLEMRSAMLATKPAASKWVVDVGTDATKTTRPAFALTNGVRATTSTGRAMSGQPCKPDVASAPSLTAGTVWAAFGPSYSPGMVALCRKVP